MGVRVLVGLLLCGLLPGAAEAADCIAVRPSDVAIKDMVVKEVALRPGAGCGELRVVQRKREDQRPNVDVGATWIEFVDPAGPGEWRYNEWIRRDVAAVNFDKEMAVAQDQRLEDHFSISSFYRSDRLISARYARRLCCSSKGSVYYASVNVDLERWTLFSPDDVLSLGAAANACWDQFAGEKRRGAAFTQAWPRERPWVDHDFEVRRLGHYFRDMVGPAVVNREVSAGRTQRVFVTVLKDQGRWSFSEQGALVDFGELLGAAPGAYTCSFATAELRAIAHPGASIPP